MRNNESEIRIESINRMILEMACGNFDCKIERSDLNDGLENVVVMINLLAEEMKASFVHRNYLNNNFNIVAGLTFILDNVHAIRAFNPAVMSTLRFDQCELEGKPFTDFLTTESKTEWDVTSTKSGGSHDTVELIFKTRQGLVVPALCTVSILLNRETHRRDILVTAFETISKVEDVDTELCNTIEGNRKRSKGLTARGTKTRISLRPSDIKRIADAREYILQHLKGDLSLKELAFASGVNESKLKYGFKQMYGITIFRFLIQARLKKAHLLLENTDIPLKNIAETTGFKSFPHFSKAFKKQFGYCPSELKRASEQNLS